MKFYTNSCAEAHEILAEFSFKFKSLIKTGDVLVAFVDKNFYCVSFSDSIDEVTGYEVVPTSELRTYLQMSQI